MKIMKLLSLVLLCVISLSGCISNNIHKSVNHVLLEYKNDFKVKNAEVHLNDLTEKTNEIGYYAIIELDEKQYDKSNPRDKKLLEDMTYEVAEAMLNNTIEKYGDKHYNYIFSHVIVNVGNREDSTWEDVSMACGGYDGEVIDIFNY